MTEYETLRNVIEEWETMIDRLYTGIKAVDIRQYIDRNGYERMRLSVTYTNYMKNVQITHTFTIRQTRLPDPFIEYLISEVVDDEFNLPDRYMDIPVKRFKTIHNTREKLRRGEYIYTHIVPDMVMINADLPEQRFEVLKQKMYILQEELR